MGATLARDEQTILPPTGEDAQRLGELAALSRVSETVAELRGPDGTVTQLPAEVYAVLRDVLDSLDRGQAITVAPHNTTLTTQEAADLLGISRPTLVRLLDEGKIPYSQPSRHRRLRLDDVLAYRQRSRHAARDGLREMAQLGQRMGETGEFSRRDPS